MPQVSSLPNALESRRGMGTTHCIDNNIPVFHRRILYGHKWDRIRYLGIPPPQARTLDYNDI